ncbi:SDR family NAD(P)-dependent oxidoreductase [Pseudochelatococcus sp. G4_1912]|uniref:SDR family NAD(P)-dependent oxidoreductase n=1 Tax=Pseudochelatococcus sp. G4_1912 TaxID=3114288 RepID=UPI0039C6734A
MTVNASASQTAENKNTLPRRLEGRTALITGASRGIGRGVALRFAREGATVAINDRDGGADAEATLADLHAATRESGFAPCDHRLIMADIASPEAVPAMIDAAVAELGRLDILVNNAGIQYEEPSESFDDARFARVLEVNLIGAARASRGAIAHFLSREGGGVIINTSSVHALIPKPGYLSYSLSKAGITNLTRTLALEFAGRGIRVNAVGPGAVITDINAAWKDNPKERAMVESHIPLGYAAEVDDISPVFAFLASDDARYITGQTLYACGGLTLFGEFRENWSS